MSSDTTELMRHESGAELSIQELAANMEKLQEVMRQVMHQDVDYGIIPGTKSKPTLLKPGAEKLCRMFRFSDDYEETVIELPGGHREYRVKCKLTHFPTGTFVGEASATCTTMESKYRYRAGSFTCPNCSANAIIKGKAEYGGGWICFAKKGGCGAKFTDNAFDPKNLAKVENPDLADSYHNVQSIAQKRAYLAATRKATASSELFTDSMEDHVVPGASQDDHHDDGIPDDRRPVEPTTQPKPAEWRDKRGMAVECPDCGKAMTLRTAKTGKNAGGKFWGCSGYPTCKKTLPVAEDGEGPQGDAGGEGSQVPQESREWQQLRTELYAIGCRAGHPEEAGLVLYSLVGDKATLAQCVKDPDAAKTVIDAIDAARTLHGMTNEDLAKQAGLLQEQA